MLLYASVKESWPASADYCYSASDFAMDGGFVGFLTGNGYVDDLTITMDSDDDGDFDDAVNDEVQVVEDFEVDTNGYAKEEKLATRNFCSTTRVTAGRCNCPIVSDSD